MTDDELEQYLQTRIQSDIMNLFGSQVSITQYGSYEWFKSETDMMERIIGWRPVKEEKK